MKKWLPLIYIGGFLVIAGIVTAAIFYFGNHSSDKSKTSQVVNCQKIGTARTVLIKDSVASPQHTKASLCDSLTITNQDSRTRLMAFGAHEDHQAYDGVIEKTLSKNQSFTVTLNQAGTYYFHDHIGDTAQGDFSVD